ncbi:hypothetical protein ES708_30051 [subsurface metagenome]
MGIGEGKRSMGKKERIKNLVSMIKMIGEKSIYPVGDYQRRHFKYI